MWIWFRLFGLMRIRIQLSTLSCCSGSGFPQWWGSILYSNKWQNIPPPWLLIHLLFLFLNISKKSTKNPWTSHAEFLKHHKSSRNVMHRDLTTRNIYIINESHTGFFWPRTINTKAASYERHCVHLGQISVRFLTLPCIYQGSIVTLASSNIDSSKFYFCEKYVNLHSCSLLFSL